jgi:hypothetical protein
VVLIFLCLGFYFRGSKWLKKTNPCPDLVFP